MLPTAPPRLLGHMGFIDTLNQSFTPTYSSIPGVNHYAALPSMHVGWTFLLGRSAVPGVQGLALRVRVFFAIPIMMFTATVVTGNHYFLDGMLGMVVASVGLCIAMLIQKRGENEPTGQLEAPSSQ